MAEGDLRPLKIRKTGRRAKPSVKGETAKGVLIGALATASVAVFASVSMLTKHKHWELEGEEVDHLSKALYDAISTLPEGAYAQVVGLIEKWFPWVQLIFVIGAIAIPRLEASAKRVEEKASGTPERADEGARAGRGGREDDYFDRFTSFDLH